MIPDIQRHVLFVLVGFNVLRAPLLSCAAYHTTQRGERAGHQHCAGFSPLSLPHCDADRSSHIVRSCHLPLNSCRRGINNDGSRNTESPFVSETSPCSSVWYNITTSLVTNIARVFSQDLPKQSEISTKGTSGGTSIATRNHVALAAWSKENSDVCGRSGFDWSAQLVRLRGSTVLLVMVYMTRGWRSQVHTGLKCGSSSASSGGCELPFICIGHWMMTPEEMQKIEMMGSVVAVRKTPLGVEFTCSTTHWSTEGLIA